MDAIWGLNFLRRRRRQREREQNIAINRARLRGLRDSSDPFAVDEVVFKGIYRLSKDMVRGLVAELRPHMAVARRSTAIPIELKVLCALHFYGQGSYQKSTGSDSNLGLCQSSVSNAIEEVTEALNTNDILTKWIHFPLQREERSRVIRKNYLATQIPGTIGYVDGTHVAIKAPKEQEHLFLNRKSYHSINVMIVSGYLVT
ncbi:putative nuclease HARBI1 [Ischnura elegans]|uniref:putative nuclease HARBI1 n=1 Tax=Ischnura elegans TaxID=197161 RepID=UPI001ED8B410|nr:putative nuclease HARBI1 [Ischnura elegans]